MSSVQWVWLGSHEPGTRNECKPGIFWASGYVKSTGRRSDAATRCYCVQGGNMLPMLRGQKALSEFDAILSGPFAWNSAGSGRKWQAACLEETSPREVTYWESESFLSYVSLGRLRLVTRPAWPPDLFFLELHVGLLGFQARPLLLRDKARKSQHS